MSNRGAAAAEAVGIESMVPRTEQEPAPSLADAPIFRRLDPRIRLDVERVSVPRTYERGQELVGERGDEPGSTAIGFVFVIWSGWCKAVRTHTDGDAAIVGIRGPGEIAAIEQLGFAGLGRRGAQAASVMPGTSGWIAASPVTAHPVEVVILLGSIDRSGWAREEAIRLLTERVTELEGVLASTQLPSEERLRRTLEDLARRFGHSGHRGRSVEVPLTQSELASLIGSTRETVNRSLRRMAAAGAIVLREGRPVLVRPVRRLRTTGP